LPQATFPHRCFFRFSPRRPRKLNPGALADQVRLRTGQRSALVTFQRRYGFMNWDQVQGQWKQMKGSIKEKWGKLTDDDLNQINGQRDQLIGKLQERYGIAREEAQKRADEWLKAHPMEQETHPMGTGPTRR
jgi:uncharacterized protein YjbJ (UPF0337 family)